MMRIGRFRELGFYSMTRNKDIRGIASIIIGLRWQRLKLRQKLQKL